MEMERQGAKSLRSRSDAKAFGLSGLARTLQKVLLWLLVYAFGYYNLDLRWAILLIGSWYLAHTYYLTKTDGSVITNEKKAPGENKKLFSQDLPAWVLHPDTQRAEWFNKILAQLWPNLDKYLKQVLKNVQDDPQLKERLGGYHIKSLRFPHVSLGNIPPRLGGVKFHESSHRDEVILDLSLQYAGDLLISMEVSLLDEKRLPPAKASIRNLTLTSTQLRIHLRPLLTDVPFVGSVTMCFLQPPDIDFDLGGLANALDIPGISLLLRHVIQDQLEQTVVMPNSFTLALIPESELADLDKKKRRKRDEVSSVVVPAGVLSVHVVEAKGLLNKDSKFLGQGKSDPYSILRMHADGASHVFRTETISNELHPIWRMLVDLPIDDPESLDDLSLEVWDEDKGSKDDFLGRCMVSSQIIRTAILSNGQTQDVWKILEGVKQGSIHVEVGWAELKLTPPSETGSNLPSYTSGGHHKAVLTVVLDSCDNLLGGRTGLKLPNPKAKVELCGIVQTTDTVVGSVDPVFEHRMNFLVNDPRSDSLQITIQDDRRDDQPLGTLRIHLSDLLARTGMTLAHNVFDLNTRTFSQGSSPTVTLSMTMRYIYRPKSTGFGVHRRSLQDLPKIITATVKPQQLLVTDFEQPVEFYEKQQGKTSQETKPMFKRMDAFSESRDGVDGKIKTTIEKPPRQSAAPNSKSDNNIPSSKLMPAMASPPNSKVPKEKDLKPRPTQQFVRTYSLPRSKSSPKELDDMTKIQLSLKYNKKTATLSVVVHRIKNIKPTTPSIPSAYVKTRLIENIGPGRSMRINQSKRKTGTQKSNIHPVFEETLEYLLPPHELKMRRLEITVCNEKFFGNSEILGRCLVSFDTVHAVATGGGDGGDDAATVTEWHQLWPPTMNANSNTTLPKDFKSGSRLSLNSLK